MVLNARELVSELCYAYGYTPNEALNVQAVQFFTLVSEGRKIKARELLDLVAIQSIAIGDHEHYTDVLNHMRSRLAPIELPPEPEMPKVSTAIQADSEEAAVSFRSIFAQAVAGPHGGH